MRISDWSSDVCSSDLPVPQVVHELQGRCRCPVANLIGQDHLAVAVQGRPRPYVAGALRGSLGALYVLGLGVAERPDFIALHPLGRNPAYGLIVQGGAGFADDGRASLRRRGWKSVQNRGGAASATKKEPSETQ